MVLLDSEAAPTRHVTLPQVEGPPSTIFTRMTAVADRWCLDCGAADVYEVEDYRSCRSRWLRPLRAHPRTYLRCGVCGSTDQPEHWQRLV